MDQAPAHQTAAPVDWAARADTAARSVTTTTNVTSTGYSAQAIFNARVFTSLIAGMPIISANATCMLGTAANGL